MERAFGCIFVSDHIIKSVKLKKQWSIGYFTVIYSYGTCAEVWTV